MYVSHFHRLIAESKTPPVLSAHEQQLLAALLASKNPAGPEARAVFDYASDAQTDLGAVHELYRQADYLPVLAFPLVPGWLKKEGE